MEEKNRQIENEGKKNIMEKRGRGEFERKHGKKGWKIKEVKGLG